jgi:arylsulfatase A-like enzyme
MQGALFAWGRGVRPGSRWPEVRIVDLYPTLCNLLGIEAADGIDGKPLSGIGVEQPAAAGGAKDSGPD